MQALARAVLWLLDWRTDRTPGKYGRAVELLLAAIAAPALLYFVGAVSEGTASAVFVAAFLVLLLLSVPATARARPPDG